MSGKSSRRAGPATPLGGQPGPYVVSTLVGGVVILPLRLPFERDDPLPYVIAYTGLWVVSIAVIAPFVEWLRRRAESPVVPRWWLRRGALVALGVGVPYYGGLSAFSVAAGPYWVFATLYLLVLAVIATIALRNLRVRA